MAGLDWDAVEMARRVQSGEVSALELVDASLERIAAVDSNIGAFLYVDDVWARQSARRLDSELTRDQKKSLPLAGVPVAIKDNLVTRQMPTTAASKMLQGFMSPYDATVVERLLAAGAIPVGKVNLDEFAMGSSTEHSAYQVTRNPWDISRVPGGSSGGSAAAVAAGMVPLALGSDTGGSIRTPASYCGVFGMKPTYGRVSRYGLIAFASSLDQVGPFSRTVRDAALLLHVISGRDPHDATSVDVSSTAPTVVVADPTQMRIGLPEEYFGDGIDPNVRTQVDAALETLKGLGATLVPISLPHTRYAIATYYLIANAEASSNLSRYDGVRYGFRETAPDLIQMYSRTRSQGFGDEVQRRILLGTHALSAGYYDAYYLKAQKVRTLIRRDFDQAFESVDLIVTPTVPDLPFKFGERALDPLQMYLTDIFTVTTNLAGLPGLSQPIGLADGLPVGLQWIAPALEEERILGMASALEAVLPVPSWPMQGGLSR